MAEKVDLKKTLPGFRATRGRFEVIDVPEFAYLMIDGHGTPGTSPAYVQALEALYPVAYKTKFASKTQLERDYVVPPLEGLWWAQDMDSFTTARDKSQWDWTLMLMLPAWVGADLVEAAIAVVGSKNPPARLGAVRIETLTEGRCVQTLHLGPYDDEGPLLQEMHHSFMPAHGLRFAGKHHEIYLGDPRRTAPEKLRTILRQPVAPA
ncbi:GyrI-like domain-containing protein [Serinibacter salmoneus]|uniref:GyrI-like small molecule binding domain-containing protein n=1 Tax=Serinibacter salmoneus TaxID=556530 RepID=A0A2A9D1F2_9MICO|nr:GyrI-like domain-containing protein [Serinibacter salmoneus]PFG20085.1 hypothetical protein ATL40_1668 [Serinibacter salmoneus]